MRFLRAFFFFCSLFFFFSLYFSHIHHDTCSCSSVMLLQLFAPEMVCICACRMLLLLFFLFFPFALCCPSVGAGLSGGGNSTFPFALAAGAGGVDASPVPQLLLKKSWAALPKGQHRGTWGNPEGASQQQRKKQKHTPKHTRIMGVATQEKKKMEVKGGWKNTETGNWADVEDRKGFKKNTMREEKKRKE